MRSAAVALMLTVLVASAVVIAHEITFKGTVVSADQKSLRVSVVDEKTRCVVASQESEERGTSESHALRPEVRDAPYQLLGSFYEACDCYTICPCWTGNNPDEGQCAAEVLKEAQAIDDRERGMYPFIRQFKSLQEAIRKFNRI